MRRFKNILCVIGTDLHGDSALARAYTLAVNNQAGLSVVQVIDEIPPNTKLMDRVMSPVNLQEKIVEAHRNGLRELVENLNSQLEIHTEVLAGIAFLEIIRYVLRNSQDLVIKMSEESSVMDPVFGSDDMHLLRKCPCPVWLVKPGSPESYDRIMAAVDVNDDYQSQELDTRRLLNQQILEMASALALSEFAELHIVHVWHAALEITMRGDFINRPEAEVVAYVEAERQHRKENLNVLMDETIGSLGQNTLDHIKPETHLLKGLPKNEIPEFARELKVELVVMGTVARTGLSGFFMGNTAESILNKLDCSVLAIKPPGFETPVTVED
jgi:nucleotide-binding universal stress UspA family protein